MADFTIYLGNKNYSSWSLRPWLVLKQTGVPFDEIVIPLYEGMGVSLLPVIGLLVALVLTSLLPLVAEATGAWRFGLPTLAGFLMVVMAVGVVVVPQFSPQSPRPAETRNARFLRQSPHGRFRWARHAQSRRGNGYSRRPTV